MAEEKAPTAEAAAQWVANLSELGWGDLRPVEKALRSFSAKEVTDALLTLYRSAPDPLTRVQAIGGLKAVLDSPDPPAEVTETIRQAFCEAVGSADETLACCAAWLLNPWWETPEVQEVFERRIETAHTQPLVTTLTLQLTLDRFETVLASAVAGRPPPDADEETALAWRNRMEWLVGSAKVETGCLPKNLADRVLALIETEPRLAGACMMLLVESRTKWAGPQLARLSRQFQSTSSVAVPLEAGAIVLAPETMQGPERLLESFRQRVREVAAGRDSGARENMLLLNSWLSFVAAQTADQSLWSEILRQQFLLLPEDAAIAFVASVWRSETRGADSYFALLLALGDADLARLKELVTASPRFAVRLRALVNSTIFPPKEKREAIEEAKRRLRSLLVRQEPQK